MARRVDAGERITKVAADFVEDVRFGILGPSISG
jgi:hypothetical protein